MLFCQKISPFQKVVYKAISRIPFGQTRSYQWVAREIGKPKAARAIGQALKKNPYPVVIPCHRVIRKDGSPGGYVLGREVKKNLLDWEKNIAIAFLLFLVNTCNLLFCFSIYFHRTTCMI